MAQLFCKPHAVSGGACRGIGKPSGCDHHRIQGHAGPVFQNDPRRGIVPAEHMTYSRPKMNLYPGLFHGPFQTSDNVGRMVGGRKRPVSSLHLDRNMAVPKKLHNIVAGKSITGAVHEFPVAHNVLQKLLHRTGIRKIAPPFSGDKELLSQLIILFIQVYFMSTHGRLYGCEHSCRAASDNSCLCHNSLPVMIILYRLFLWRWSFHRCCTPDTRPRFPPSSQASPRRSPAVSCTAPPPAH